MLFANVLFLHQNGRTPFVEAVLQGHTPVVKLFLDRGANVDEVYEVKVMQTMYGPLHFLTPHTHYCLVALFKLVVK